MKKELKMEQRQTFKDRLEILMGGDKPYSWSKKVGIEKGLFQYYWQKGKVPTQENLLKIQRYSGCSLDWLLTGRSPVLTGQVEHLTFEKASSDADVRRMGFVKAGKTLHALYGTASFDDLAVVDRFLEAMLTAKDPTKKR